LDLAAGRVKPPPHRDKGKRSSPSPGRDAVPFVEQAMKLVIKRKLPKRRIPHRPTKVQPLKVRYERKRAKQSTRQELKAEGEAT